MINEETQLKIDETFKSYHPDETKTNLCPGSSVEVFASSPNPDNELIFELAKKSPDELITLAVENITKEKQIMDEVMNVIEKWKSASLGTNAIRKVLEYLSFDEDIQHSSNEWEEISKPEVTFSNYIDDDDDKLNLRSHQK